MLVAQYIAKFIKEKGTSQAFGYPGGMITFLMDAFEELTDFKSYSLYHEQSAAFAACAYSQSSNLLGVAYATSGPGVTNLVTGIAHAYYESIPILFITGQVNTKDSKGDLKIRQKGFQETDVVSLVSSITKYATYISSAEDIKFELEKAFYYATKGRPGPVLLDIPIDIQRTEINPNSLKSFQTIADKIYDDENILYTLKNSINNSKRPVILLGNGINISNTRPHAKKFIENLQIPVVTSMIAVDLIETEHPLNFGFIGAYGNRYSNILLSQSDLIITLGSRLDIRQTGSNVKEFAKNATIIRFDIDDNEFTNKINDKTINLKIDLKSFFQLILEEKNLNLKSFPNWIKQCLYYKAKLLNIDDMLPNEIVRKISKMIPNNSTITTDVGQNQVWVSQSFNVKNNQRILYTGGHGAMGYSLPASIGAYYASKNKVFCFTGDGGMQINIQELQFIFREKLPIKIFILNNNSLGMIRHFQEMYFDSKFTQTVESDGYSAPNFVDVGIAYKIKSIHINSIDDIDSMKEMLESDEPCLFDIHVGNTTFTYPKLEFTKPFYDQEPPLDRDLLNELLNYEDK